VEVIDETPWDAKWDRLIRYRSPDRVVGFPQHLAVLNTTYAEVHCTKDCPWVATYLTSELGAETVRKLLADHPDFADKKTLEPAERFKRRMRMYLFLRKAGFLDEAAGELDLIAKEYPAEKVKVGAAREILNKLLVQRQYEDIRIGDKAGRHAWVAEQLKAINQKYATPKAVGDIQALTASYKAAAAKQKEVLERLTTLLAEVSPAERAFFTAAVKQIAKEIHAEGLERLDPFLDQARQAERKAKAGRKVEVTTEDLLALAVSGWLLGPTGAESKLETAMRAWNGRELVSDYLTRGKGALGRAKNTKGGLPSVDEMLQILPLMQPPKAEQNLPEGVSEQKTDNRNFYALQLPLGYSHNRPYPVLVALHTAGEKPEAMLKRVSEEGVKRGYIVVAPEWSSGQRATPYGYTADEHDIVFDVLRDLRERFNVDSDRVFLMGYGEGGTMAFDVGLSHPGEFAGVLPVAGNPAFFPRKYWANAQYLPFYVVTGDTMGKATSYLKDLFQKWVLHGYPALHVMYRGRGAEWFKGEVPSMFEWMTLKKRSIPATELGRFGFGADEGDTFKSMREGKNNFYWITTNGTYPRFVNDRARWDPRKLPAWLNAHLDPKTNRIYIREGGFTGLTVWLRREGRLDFQKPITVYRNGGTIRNLSNLKITASLETLLEDVAKRGDRKSPYVARIDVGR
jgi:pimeloyl-ACP methyl ester carboxylesterase